ncbi:hypothetical protein [Idiomarina sp.]|uniref:hypothetical protein n=1 Tax=Idiomarina sp. TaxID=1874361 RepID=UPI003A91375F
MFDAVTYWRERPIKKFVVKLVDGDEFQNLLVSAPNETRAREQALQKTSLSSEHAVVKEMRLAEPADLGIMNIDAMTLHDHENDWYRNIANETGLSLVEYGEVNGTRHFYLCSIPAHRKMNEWMSEPDEELNPAITKEQMHSALRDCIKAMHKVRSFEGTEEEFYSALRMAEYLTLEQEVEHA